MKSVQFRRPPRPVGAMMQHVMNMQRRDIDELIILDINASRERREPAYSKVEEYASQLYCPLTIGGGITKLEHIKNLLNSGADKVAIKSSWKLILEANQKFGAQCIVGAIDCDAPRGCSHLCTSGVDLVDAAPGEILLTSISQDGTRKGYNLRMLREFREIVRCPIIINGGCGDELHMLEAIQEGADAVAASSVFLFTGVTPKSCAKFLHSKGVNVRLDEGKFVSDMEKARLAWEASKKNDRDNPTKKEG